MPASPSLPLFIGCPVWTCKEWVGDVYPARAKRQDWLSAYTSMFNTVEGNSTFYAMPTLEVVTRWSEQAADGFRFSLKFPRSISHEAQLVGAKSDTQYFLKIVDILAKADCLGPSFLQLGPNFGPERFGDLQAFLCDLPGEYPWAVEVRHHAWFDQADNESRLNDLLRLKNIDKVLFDSRPLYQAPPDDPIEATSQTRKPKTPVRQTVTGSCPMLRLVGRNRIEMVDSFLDQWAPIVAKWICDGLAPYVFTHAPNDAFAPALARRFIARLQMEFADRKLTLPDPINANLKRQLSLLD